MRPPAPQAREGRGEAAPPRTVQPGMEPGARPPLPRQPLEATGWVVSPKRPCREETERKRAQHRSPWSRGFPLLDERAELGPHSTELACE